ncbi:hypothetical protein [Bradyrhizobium sp. AZCC 2289]|uniref:hypothetical protein n=1 Tax=Bradyrhizobium sp. AZCC 2289 TaxID=3117026 RepID=UPI002FF0277F
MTEVEVREFLRDAAAPMGHRYTLVVISIAKRYLACEIDDFYRLKFLEFLDKWARDDNWLTVDMIAAIEPVCDNGYEIVCEAQKLGAKKSLDVYAEVFPTFAVLNPSLITALKLSPIYQGHAAYRASHPNGAR